MFQCGPTRCAVGFDVPSPRHILYTWHFVYLLAVHRQFERDVMFDSKRNESAGSRIGAALGAGVLVLAATLLPGLAWADGGSVRYSYERAEVGGVDQWVLVPRAEKAMRGEVTERTLRKTFRALKSDKKATYGASTVKISGKLPDAARVSVKIDPKFAQYSLIIMAETVYTMTEFGVPGVEFPGYFEGVMSRADIPFAAYTLTVPLWQFVPLRDVSSAQVRLPDGSLAAAAEIAERWEKGDKALREAFFSYLDSKDPFTVIQVLGKVEESGLPYVERVTPLLKSDAETVRKRALEALAAEREDERVLKAVASRLEVEESPALAGQAAEFLAKSKNKRFQVLEAFYWLKSEDAARALAATKALGGAAGDERVPAELYRALSNKHAGVPAQAAASLEQLDADEQQVKALGDDALEASLRMSIAETLAQDDVVASRLAGLRYVANQAGGVTATRAIEGLGELGTAEARAAIAPFLTRADERKRRAAAQTLRAGGEAEALDAFGDALSTLKDAPYVAQMAYELMRSQPLDTITELADADQDELRQLAYRALGERAAEQGAGDAIFDKLADGTKSSNAGIRAASARALGAFANEPALALLKKLENDRSGQVRAGVALALGQYDEGQSFDTLVSYLDDKDPAVVAGALRAMAARKEAAKWDRIKELTKSSKAEVRAAAYFALASLVSSADKEGLRNVISMLSGAVNDDDRMVQLTAVRRLGSFKDEKAVTGIALQLNAADELLRVTAIAALGANGHPAALGLLGSALDDPEVYVRRAAVEALGEFGGGQAQSRLKARLDKEEDGQIKSLIEKTLRK